VEAFLTFAISSDIAQSLRQDPAYTHGKNARSLVRSSELTMVTTVLKAGAELKPHHAPASSTAIVLEGEILFRTHGATPTENILRQHDCAVFSSETQHSVEARTDSLILIVMGAKA
jgi:quercetin dioxygenase-like cupin family protein